MLAIYSSLDVWLGIILGGIAGCLATAYVVHLMKGVPVSAIGSNVNKHIWSIIFAIPMPFLLVLGGGIAGLVLAFIWLLMAPTVGSKAYFGPKDAPWQTLMTYHSGYAVAALVVYYLVVRLI